MLNPPKRPDDGISINLPALNIQRIEVTLIGDTALIMHKWSEKAKKEMLDKQMKKATQAREAKDPTRAFINLRPAEESDRVYENIVSVMSDDLKRAQVLKRAKDELGMWRKRYSDLTEFADVFGAIDQTLEVA